MAGTQKSRSDDLLFVAGPTESGDAYNVVRTCEERIEIGELRKLREGRPIEGEVVKLTRRPEHERLFSVETVLSSSELRRVAGRTGPAQVATEEYRENWASVFSPKDNPPN